MSYLKFSKNLAKYLSSKTELTHEKEIILAYAIEVLFLNVANLFATLLLGYFLGVLPGTIICCITMFLFRHTAGGAHSTSALRCALITIIVFPFLALVASRLILLNQLYTDIITLFCILICFVMVYIHAPVDSPAAPIISSDRRNKLKRLSVTVTTLITIMILILKKSQFVYSNEIHMSLALTMLWVSFILSKPGHSIMTLIDNIGLNTIRR